MDNTTHDCIKRLNSLLMLDHDAIESYDQAIRRIENTLYRDRLSEFRSDHERHVPALVQLIERMGGKPQSRTDIKGFFLKGFTALQSMVGDEAALRAMHANERLTNNTYQEALNDPSITGDARLLVERHRADEARHLAWIERALHERQSARTQPPVTV